jgi:hypothetical protein
MNMSVPVQRMAEKSCTQLSAQSTWLWIAMTSAAAGASARLRSWCRIPPCRDASCRPPDDYPRIRAPMRRAARRCRKTPIRSPAVPGAGMSPIWRPTAMVSKYSVTRHRRRPLSSQIDTPVIAIGWCVGAYPGGSTAPVRMPPVAHRCAARVPSSEMNFVGRGPEVGERPPGAPALGRDRGVTARHAVRIDQRHLPHRVLGVAGQEAVQVLGDPARFTAFDQFAQPVACESRPSGRRGALRRIVRAAVPGCWHRPLHRRHGVASANDRPAGGRSGGSPEAASSRPVQL